MRDGGRKIRGQGWRLWNSLYPGRNPLAAFLFPLHFGRCLSLFGSHTPLQVVILQNKHGKVGEKFEGVKKDRIR